MSAGPDTAPSSSRDGAAAAGGWALIVAALAFAFGLIHGFGFASVLGELGLPQDARLIALVAFNLGVEVGQLAIVGVALPLALSIRYFRMYWIRDSGSDEGPCCRTTCVQPPRRIARARRRGGIRQGTGTS